MLALTRALAHWGRCPAGVLGAVRSAVGPVAAVSRQRRAGAANDRSPTHLAAGLPEVVHGHEGCAAILGSLGPTVRHHSASASAFRGFERAITPRVAAELTVRGYAVVDDVLDPATVFALRKEIRNLKTQEKLHLNCTHLVKGNTTELLEKSDIYEAELSLDPEIQQLCPSFAQVAADTSLRTMLSLFLPQLTLDTQNIKLQYNLGGGGCFPMHFDSDEQIDGRKITAIMYLNEDWQPSHGGQLRLYPFPDRHVDIPPVAGRLALFASSRMCHRVLPSVVERHCFTIWLSQSRRSSRPPVNSPSIKDLVATEPPADDARAWAALCEHPRLYAPLVKYAHRTEWADSIRESHPPGAARAAALDTLEAEMEALRGGLGPWVPWLEGVLGDEARRKAIARAVSMTWIA